MNKSRSILVVGHKSWGKSKTLQALTGGKHSVIIGGRRFFVRVMSNDDRPEEYIDFIKRLNGEPFIILAFCPTFQDDGDAPTVLQALHNKGYELSFFVLKDRFKRSKRKANEINSEEIEAMRAAGQLKTLATRMEAKDRADELRQFIETELKRA